MACSEETMDLHPDRYDYYSILRHKSENQTKLKVLQTVIDKALVGTSLEHEFAGIRDAFYEDMQDWYIHESIEKWKINDDGRFYLGYTLAGDFQREFNIVFTDYVPDSPLLDQSFVFAFPDDHEEYKTLSLREILYDDESEILNAMIYRCRLQESILCRDTAPSKCCCGARKQAEYHQEPIATMVCEIRKH